MAALTDAEILEQYKLARDALVAAIIAGQSIVEYQIMSQRKRVSDPIAALREVQTQIKYYETKVAASTSVSSGTSGSNTGSRGRNYFELHRR